MSDNLNQNLYSRFGLQLDIQRVQDGCKKYFKGLLVDILGPITTPDDYKKNTKLWSIQFAVLDEVCRQLFLDADDWYGTSYSSGLKRLIEHEISDDFSGSFTEYLFRLQILINVVANHDFIRRELNQLASEIEKYFKDYPILGVTIKIYKRKAPQILPSVSKFFDKEIENTLGLLEIKKYKNVLNDFEEGLKEFLTAKTNLQLKDVIEDMLSACDELVKIISGQKNKGFKHIFKKDEYKKLELNQNQKEIYRNLKDWMDKIKHGSIKEFDRTDVEMVISLTASFLRIAINKYEQKT